MADETQQSKEQLAFQERLLQYTERMYTVEQKLVSAKKDKVATVQKELVAAEKLIKAALAKGDITVREGAKELALNKARQKEFSQYAKSTAEKSAESLLGLNLSAQELLSKTAIGAVALLLLAQVDAQKRLQTLVGFSGNLYGKLGKEGGENFGSAYINSLSKYAALINDQNRGKFLKALLDIGAPLRGVSGGDFKVLSDQLLLLSQAFNVSGESMAEMLFNFQDTFQKSTLEAGTDIKKLANTALSLQVAPSRLLSLVNNLTSSFRLQKMSIQDITSVFVSYRRSAELGVEAATELTQKTVSALAGLDEGKIAGLLALTSPKGGAELGKGLVDFFKIGGKGVSSRLDLALSAFKKLETRFDVKDEFVKTRLIMKTFGVQDFSTGVQLLNAVEKSSKTAGGTKDAIEEASSILEGTTGTVEMMNNILQNLTGRMFATLVPAVTAIYGFARLSVGGIKDLVMGKDANDALVADRMQLMNERAGVMSHLLDAQNSGNTTWAKIDQEHLKDIDKREADLTKVTTGTGKALVNLNTTGIGLFDTMADHLSKIKSNTLSAALSSKAIASAQEKMTIPVGTAGVAMMTPTAMKDYIESKIAAAKVPLDVKVTVQDTTGVFKAVQTFSAAVK